MAGLKAKYSSRESRFRKGGGGEGGGGTTGRKSSSSSFELRAWELPFFVL